MLMFHEAARGQSYTGLTHRYQPQIDLSEHVRLGQAVLVGRAERPGRPAGTHATTQPLAEPDDDYHLDLVSHHPARRTSTDPLTTDH